MGADGRWGRFLRIDHLVEPPRVWARLLTPQFAPQFAELFRRVSIRTLKSAVKDELTIPEQTRFLVPVALGPVERHVSQPIPKKKTQC